jgi:hypothetical protein
MTDRLPDRWASRDLPVLRHVVNLIDSGEDLCDKERIMTELGISDQDAEAAAHNLERGGYMEVQWMEGGSFFVEKRE